jgi:thioredoxin-like negative regulator of GroEL
VVTAEYFAAHGNTSAFDELLAHLARTNGLTTDQVRHDR